MPEETGSGRGERTIPQDKGNVTGTITHAEIKGKQFHSTALTVCYTVSDS